MVFGVGDAGFSLFIGGFFVCFAGELILVLVFLGDFLFGYGLFFFICRLMTWFLYRLEMVLF